MGQITSVATRRFVRCRSSAETGEWIPTGCSRLILGVSIDVVYFFSLVYLLTWADGCIFAWKFMCMQYEFYKNEDSDKVWWVETQEIGNNSFSFDKKKVYNLFRDYPHALSQEERAIFDAENPYWADFFKCRWAFLFALHDICCTLSLVLISCPRCFAKGLTARLQLRVRCLMPQRIVLKSYAFSWAFCLVDRWKVRTFAVNSSR